MEVAIYIYIYVYVVRVSVSFVSCLFAKCPVYGCCLLLRGHWKICFANKKHSLLTISSRTFELQVTGQILSPTNLLAIVLQVLTLGTPFFLGGVTARGWELDTTERCSHHSPAIFYIQNYVFYPDWSLRHLKCMMYHSCCLNSTTKIYLPP